MRGNGGAGVERSWRAYFSLRAIERGGGVIGCGGCTGAVLTMQWLLPRAGNGGRDRHEGEGRGAVSAVPVAHQGRLLNVWRLGRGDAAVAQRRSSAGSFPRLGGDVVGGCLASPACGGMKN